MGVCPNRLPFAEWRYDVPSKRCKDDSSLRGSRVSGPEQRPRAAVQQACGAETDASSRAFPEAHGRSCIASTGFEYRSDDFRRSNIYNAEPLDCNRLLNGCCCSGRFLHFASESGQYFTRAWWWKCILYSGFKACIPKRASPGRRRLLLSATMAFTSAIARDRGY